MTRTKDELDLIVPQRLFMYQHNGHDSGHVYSKISRFIPKSIHHAFERKHWSEPGAEPRFANPSGTRERIDVVGRVEECGGRDIWTLRHIFGRPQTYALNGDELRNRLVRAADSH